MSFELFEKHADKDVFYGKVQAVRRTLSSFPLPELGELSGIGDAQVFSMQQRAIGETLAVNQGESIRCMRFSEFTHEWHKPDFRSRFDPLIRFVHGLEPAQSCRWRRVELMAEALRQLRSECQRLLSITSATLSTADVERFRSG